MLSKLLQPLVQFCVTTIILLLIACGGNSNQSNTNSPLQNASMKVVISDDPTEDWATVGVKVLSISLTPQGGGTPVTVYTAPTPVPIFNLVQLDQIGDLLCSASVPPGMYQSATLTLSANPGDVTLVASADPETGFAGTAGATIPSNQIQIQNTQGSTGSLTVPLNVNFSSPLTATANQSNAMDLEFDLAHPAFIIPHVPLGGGATIWSVDFNPAFRHHPIADITRLVLRHLYGTVMTVSSDNSSITIARDFPVEPPTNPETAIVSSQNLTILADSINGTIFYDLDAGTTTTITNFSAQAGTLVNKFVRVAARFQSDDSLVAVRIWASSTFQNVWVSPEGFVLNVNSSTDVLTVDNEDGVPVALNVNGNTQFFFRNPGNGAADAAPIGTGTGFLSNLFRGFKVHVSVVDPLASPFVAQTVDIETAAFSGAISATNTTGFTDTRSFHTAADDYTITLDYVASDTPNGDDANGNPVTGFKWWNFTLPTLADTGSTAIPDFIAATNGAVNFGGTAPAMQVFGGTYGVWNNSASPDQWSALWTYLVPVPTPLATVAANWVTNSNGGSFGITVANGGATPVTVNASSVTGSQTLVYQVDRTNGIVTVSPQDITTTAGLNNIAANLVSPTLVKVFGVPQANGTINAYVVVYFTGTQPAS
ncbi:MAG TPA: DUF4382 domain-containing protein [Terriglobia bacterium]|nr:DUF4382 domain-containing protein [Terriglobia bacterium]